MKLSTFAPLPSLLTLAAALSACIADDDDPYEPDDAELGTEPEAQRPETNTRALAAATGPIAQLPGFDVEITLDGDDVVLSWADLGASEYEVWTSPYPYFSPMMTGSGGMPVGTTSGQQFTLPGDNSPMAPAYAYYAVVAVDGGAPEVSTIVGRHGLTLFPGFNKVPLSLQTGFGDASDLFDAMSPAVVQTHYFDSSIQDWVSWNPASIDPPFSVQDGDTPVVEMDITEPVYRAIAGYVPAPFEAITVPLLPGDNLVTLPLDFPEVLASDLLAAVPGLMMVARWDPAIQAMDFGEELTIPPGGDMHLFVSEESAWPIPVTLLGLSGPEGPAEQGDCCSFTSVPGCTDPGLEACVCASDSFCCDVAWDSLCVDEVESFGCGSCGG